jgi:hypothetical protein
MKTMRISSSSLRYSFLPASRALQMSVSVLLISIAFVFALRWLEHAMIYHPVGYAPGSEWTPPQNGEDVWFNVASGERLHGWFVRAAQQPARATILHFHGNGGNVTNVGWLAAALAKRGFDVLVFDYRGYGRSEGRLPDEAGLNADGAAAYDYLTRERAAAPEKLVLYGLSLGTTVAIDLAAQRRCAALIVESGLSSASALASDALPWLPSWLHRLGKNRFESARKLPNANCPVLFTHGTNDEVIPVEHGRRLFAAAREPKRLELVGGGDHNLIGSGGAAYLDNITEFLHHSLK